LKYILEKGNENNFKEVGSYTGEDRLFNGIKTAMHYASIEQSKKEKENNIYWTKGSHTDIYREFKKDDGYTYVDYGNPEDFFRYKKIED
jgi:hypothetical protein